MTRVIRYVPQLGGNQKTRIQRKPTSQEKRKTRSKAERAGIVVSGEETEGQQNDHQKRDGNDELRENCKKCSTFEASDSSQSKEESTPTAASIIREYA